MRVVAAYLLAVLGGNENPDKAAVKKILDSVGATADDAQLDKVISELKGKDLDALIAEGSKKISAVPVGGGGGGAAAPAAAAGGAAPKAEEKKEDKKKKEESEESGGADMGFSLFDWKVLSSSSSLSFNPTYYLRTKYSYYWLLNKKYYNARNWSLRFLYYLFNSFCSRQEDNYVD